MNEAMIYSYCHVVARKGFMILFYEDGDPFLTAQNLATGEMWSCEDVAQFNDLCEII